MKMRVARLHHPVTTLGPGQRIGIWMQGCGIGCAGCLSQDTWATDDSTLIELDEVVRWIGERDCRRIDGLTVTGGEPSEQPEALAALLERIAGWRGDYGWDVMCYTGVEEDEFARRCPAVHESVDVLITGPYRAGQPTDLVWRGSANQRMILRTELGVQRYSRYVAEATGRPGLQVQFQGDGLFVIGVPRAGDMARLARRLNSQGIELRGVSWRRGEETDPAPRLNQPPD